MKNKRIKKTTGYQMKTLVLYMEKHPEIAKGIPVCNSNRPYIEKCWREITIKLNSIGPPTRSLAEWKKTWADLKSRTKKKLSDNKKSLLEGHGGIYRMSDLTKVEEIIARAITCSSVSCCSVSNCDPLAYNEDNDEIVVKEEMLEDGSFSFIETSNSVISPPANNESCISEPPTQIVDNQFSQEEKASNLGKQKKKKKKHMTSDQIEDTPCSSPKKNKCPDDEKNELIRQQIKISEEHLSITKTQNEILKRLADAAAVQADAAIRSADATESLAKSLLAIQQAALRIENMFKNNTELKIENK
ncbi:uncharacterized protein [Musca autumnalis]|uniref:uncharacterized protein n=1 Tax=Musca autumnalis TaxID=221902 RepID=UPI003CEC2FD2